MLSVGGVAVSEDQSFTGRLGNRWRARAEQRRRDVGAISSTDRIRDNPYLLLLKYGCIGTGVPGLLMLGFGEAAATMAVLLLSWSGLSLIAHITTCALLWRPSTEGDPPDPKAAGDDGPAPTGRP